MINLLIYRKFQVGFFLPSYGFAKLNQVVTEVYSTDFHIRHNTSRTIGSFL